MSVGPNSQELLKSLHKANDDLYEEIHSLRNMLNPVLLPLVNTAEDSVKELNPINTPLNSELEVVLNNMIGAIKTITEMKSSMNL